MVVNHISTLEEYCRNIGIPDPKSPIYDIRSFEENMKTVKAKVEPFRHEFYAVALRVDGDGFTKTGQFAKEHDTAYTLFFNSPYQEISWDIVPNWSGYYILITAEFMEQYLPQLSILNDYPFFRIDQTIPMQLTQEEAMPMLSSFAVINDEYYGSRKDSFRFISPHTRLLLEHTRRCFEKHAGNAEGITEKNRTADVMLVSRLKVLIESSFSDPDPAFHPHSATLYADYLHVHPNYLNAVVKRTTGKTLKALIQDGVIYQAKSLLASTALSNKEISYRLHFEEPTHFNALFKKLTQLTPGQYRESLKEA
jgi:AraC-like DNA-binding protein